MGVTCASAAGRDRISAAVWGDASAARPRCARIAVVGTCKNAGKTTALNALAAAAAARGWPVGLLSIGRDGEERDAWLDTPKPPVRVEAGAWVATARSNALRVGPALEIAEVLPGGHPLGPAVIAVARAPAEVELAGIAHRGHLAVALAHLARRAAVVIVDGAYHRQAAAHPDLVDAVVIAVGAAAGDDDDLAVGAALPTLRALATPAGTAPPGWTRMAGALGDTALSDHTGAAGFVVRDPTRVLLSARGWQAADRRGQRVVADRAAPVVALVVNPWRADRPADPVSFAAAVARARARASLGDVAVIDLAAP